MSKFLFLVFFSLCIASLGILSADGLPAYLSVAQNANDANQAQVLYQGESFTLKVHSDILSRFPQDVQNATDLYAVRIPRPSFIESLSEYGEVLYLSNTKNEAILKIATDEKADNLAAAIHKHSSGLAGTPVVKLMSAKEAITGFAKPVVEAIENTAKRVEKLRSKEADPKIKEIVSLVDEGNLRKFTEDLSRYRNRYYKSTYGKDSSNFIYESFSHYTKYNPALSVRQFAHSSSPQPSVIATLKGTKYPDEIVIVGCHIDSLASSSSNDQDAPGADDDASGTSAVKEMLRILASHNYRFQRTIEFHGYAAEEIGLVGSGNVAATYKSEGKKVIGMIQMDMIMYLKAGNVPTIFLVTNNTTTQHNDLACDLVEKYTTVKWQKGQLWAGSSDHRSWTSRGYPGIFPFEDVVNYNKKVHTNGDTIANSGNFNLAKNFTQLGIAYLTTLAELD